MKSKITVSAALVAVLTLSTSGDITHWNGSSGLVTLASNWSIGLPDKSLGRVGNASSGRIQGGGNDFSSKDFLFDNSVNVDIDSSGLNLTDSTMLFSGSSSMVSLLGGDVVLGSGIDGLARITVAGSSIVVGTGNLTLGGGSRGEIIQQSGNVIFQNGMLTLGGDTNDTRGKYTLSGGIVQVKDIAFTYFDSRFNFTRGSSGTLMVSTNGATVQELKTSIQNGNITLNDQTVDPDTYFNVEDKGNGYIAVGVVIPEPAVVGLLGFSGIGIILYRRLFGRRNEGSTG